MTKSLSTVNVEYSIIVVRNHFCKCFFHLNLFGVESKLVHYLNRGFYGATSSIFSGIDRIKFQNTTMFVKVIIFGLSNFQVTKLVQQTQP